MVGAIKFFVPGNPVPKGSAKGFVVKDKKSGKHRAIITQDNGEKQKPWASLISVTAQEHYQGPLMTGPVSLTLYFVMSRPKHHFRQSKGQPVLKAGAPYWHTVKPDADKLVRCVKDALTEVIWKDDCQVCRIGEVKKIYGPRPGVHLEIKAIEEF